MQCQVRVGGGHYRTLALIVILSPNRESIAAARHHGVCLFKRQLVIAYNRSPRHRRLMPLHVIFYVAQI